MNVTVVYKTSLSLQPIDYDQSTTHKYAFKVKVQDPYQNHSDTIEMYISVYDINDNAPVFSPVKQSVTLSEDTAVETAVASFTATDSDEGINAMFE